MCSNMREVIDDVKSKPIQRAWMRTICNQRFHVDTSGMTHLMHRIRRNIAMCVW